MSSYDNELINSLDKNQVLSFENSYILKTLDKSNMFDAVFKLPEQMEETIRLASDITLNKFENDISYVIITGVGGSAIAGDLMRVMLNNVCRVPVLVNRDYSLPAFVGPDSLVIASSYSGDTEETLSAYMNAKEKKANIIAITTGGTLGKLAAEDKYTLITMPSGLSPRAAIGYSLVSLVSVLSKAGLVNDMSSQIRDAVLLLKKMRTELEPAVGFKDNLAKQIAQKLFGRLPVIYGSTGTTDVIAQRWKTQICENAKTIAYNNVFPELDHNEIVGSEYPEDIVKNMTIVILKDKEDHERNKLRMNITSELLKGKVHEIIEVNSRGNNPFERMLSLVFIGDYISLYLSIAYGKDPTPIDRISALKDRLSKH